MIKVFVGFLIFIKKKPLLFIFFPSSVFVNKINSFFFVVYLIDKNKLANLKFLFFINLHSIDGVNLPWFYIGTIVYVKFWKGLKD